MWGTSPFIKLLKSFRSDHKQASNGWVKDGKNDAKFQIHEPFDLESLFFIGILKTMF